MKIDQLMFQEYFRDEQLFKSPIYEANPQLGHAALAVRIRRDHDTQNPLMFLPLAATCKSGTPHIWSVF